MATGIRVDFSELRRSIDLKRQQLSDTAIQERLRKAAEVYVEVLRFTIRSRVSARASGNMEDALCNIVGPWRTARGWAIGVGDIARVGLPSDAPKSRSTIQEFIDWLNEALEEGEPRAVAAQAERVRARAEQRRRRRAARAEAAAKPAPEPTKPSEAQQQRAILKAARERRAAQDAEASDLAKRIRDRWDELRQQRIPGPTSDAERMTEATESARVSLIYRAVAIRREIRATSGTDGASILKRRGLRAQLAAVRRLLKIMRESE